MIALNYRFLCFSELGTDLLVQRQPTTLNWHFGSIMLSHNLQRSWIWFFACKTVLHGNLSLSSYYQYYYQIRILHWGHLGLKLPTFQGKESFYIFSTINQITRYSPESFLTNKSLPLTELTSQIKKKKKKVNKINSFTFSCAFLSSHHLFFFFFWVGKRRRALNTTQRVPKTHKAFSIEKLNSQKKNIA